MIPHAPHALDPHASPPFAQPARAALGGWRTTLAFALAFAFSCTSAAPPGGANARVYRSASLEAAQVHGQGWRFLPLRPGQLASQREFDQAAASCLTREGVDAVRFCMTQRGFYPTACDDGVDNDGDGLVDHPADPGCAEPISILEDPACDDGRDNDGDGFVDWDGGGVAHEDPDCESGSQPEERTPGRFFRR